MGDGPIAVQVPWDVLNGELSDSVVDDERYESGTATNPVTSDGQVRPDDDAVEAAVDLYLDSDATKIPMIIAGRGTIRADARDAIESFAERTNGVLVTTLQLEDTSMTIRSRSDSSAVSGATSRTNTSMKVTSSWRSDVA